MISEDDRLFHLSAAMWAEVITRKILRYIFDLPLLVKKECCCEAVGRLSFAFGELAVRHASCFLALFEQLRQRHYYNRSKVFSWHRLRLFYSCSSR